MMHKRYFLLPLLLLTASGAWACNPAQGTGQCGYQGYDGVYGTYGEAQDSYRNAYPQPTYAPPQIYVPPPTPQAYTPPTPQAYTPPPIRESRYGAVAYYENPNGEWNSRTMFTSVHNISSKQRARQMALQACNRKSGRTCKIMFDYTNHRSKCQRPTAVRRICTAARPSSTEGHAELPRRKCQRLRVCYAGRMFPAHILTPRKRRPIETMSGIHAQPANRSYQTQRLPESIASTKLKRTK